MNEREAFEAWFKEKSPVCGINAKLAARDAWLARAAVEADRAQRVPDVENLKDRLVAISSAVADSDDREAQAIIRTTLELLASTPTPAPAQREPATPMDAHRAAYFMRRFLHEEKMLGPNEQAALHFTIAALEAMESAAQHQEPPQQERKPMTDEEIERGRKETFSTENPFCPCDSKTMRKAVRWAERHHGIKE